MPYRILHYDTIRYDTIRYDTIRYDTIRYDTIRYDTIRFDTIRYDTIHYDTVRDNSSILDIKYDAHDTTFAKKDPISRNYSIIPCPLSDPAERPFPVSSSGRVVIAAAVIFKPSSDGIACYTSLAV